MIARRQRVRTTLVTLNVRGFQIGGVSFKKRIGMLFKLLDTMEVDELHLQEVYTYGMLQYLRRGLGSHFPYVSFSKSVFGPKAGLTSFFRVPPVSTDFHRLPASPIATIDRLGLIPYIHKGILATALDSGELRFNLHLSSDHSGEWRSDSSSMQRITAQLEVVANIVLRFGKSGGSFVVMGDFNLPTETSAYVEFVERLNAHDAMRGDDRPTFHKAFLPAGRVPRQIDHVLIALQSADEVACRLILSKPKDGVYASDHLGVSVSFA